jgi:hypothetical protein
MNTKSPHIPSSFRGENTGEVNKASVKGTYYISTKEVVFIEGKVQQYIFTTKLQVAER